MYEKGSGAEAVATAYGPRELDQRLRLALDKLEPHAQRIERVYESGRLEGPGHVRFGQLRTWAEL
jgi:hypothetical protein